MTQSALFVVPLLLCGGAISLAEAGDGKSAHWSLQPVTRPRVPEIQSDDWSCNPVDRFLLSRLEQKRLTPSPPATRRTLIRRASFDLLGLPPHPTALRLKGRLLFCPGVMVISVPYQLRSSEAARERAYDDDTRVRPGDLRRGQARDR